MGSGGNFGLQEEGEGDQVLSQLERLRTSGQLMGTGASPGKLRGHRTGFQHTTPNSNQAAPEEGKTEVGEG